MQMAHRTENLMGLSWESSKGERLECLKANLKVYDSASSMEGQSAD
jgi:hypothetical protein